MKNSLLLLATLALPALGRLTLHRRDNPAVVTLDIQRKDVADPVARDRMRRKRDKTVSQNLDNEVRLQPIPPCSSPSRSQLSGNPLFLQRLSGNAQAELALSLGYR